MEVSILLSVRQSPKMTKNDLLSALKSSKFHDYTYAVLFFAVSAFFAFFVIRPVLSIALGIRREAMDLTEINNDYEKNIQKVLELQYDLEQLRPRRGLIDEALPNQPIVPELIVDIQNASAQAGISVTALQIDPILFKSENEKSTDPKAPAFIQATFKSSASFAQIQQFLEILAKQRRVKGLRNIRLNLDQVQSQKVVSLDIEVEAYYTDEQ